MALGNNQNNGGATFLDIRQGKVTKRVDGPGEGVVERTVTKGKSAGMVIYEAQYGYVEGVIKGVKWQSREADINGKKKVIKTLQVSIDDVGEKYVLQLPRGYKVTRHFALALKNINEKQPVRFEPYDYVSKKDGKRKSGLGLTQGGNKVDWAFTRGDGKLPDAPMVKVNGEDVVNYEAQDAFLDGIIEQEAPRFGTVQEAEPKGDLPWEGREVAVDEDENPF
jgi:hypothetical protein